MLYRLRIAAFFCVMMPRHVFEKVGELDEQFVPGFFEDDDYCLRVQKAGFLIACAEDVFVHHELSASFDQLSVARRQAIFDRNKSLFEEKWGPWVPHKYRPESTQSAQKSLEANGYPR
jgi:GT2 family glycosyltransferase